MQDSVTGPIIIGESIEASPIKRTSVLDSTAEVLQMLRRDVKPGNGTSLLTY